jgi:hypothetical protein
MEYKANFELEVSENKVVIFFPIHVHGHSEISTPG